MKTIIKEWWAFFHHITFFAKSIELKTVHVYIHCNTRSPAQVILLAPNSVIFLIKLYYYKYPYFIH
ncbi:hypothetical protein DU80_20500 [Methanosarcina mazei]|uniref:Uncharacterized protein n=1 Tax=Methanosarcina mazei TaxID=2209 RepID=A0A0F8RCX0_METMZ|nr:hypothetical protein DU31_14090 [Methanosarcina mazei]KKG04971.1 hypothetical protein DU40_18155 [Methanosarcina mazei]KKG07078.1 hypothetical protein DU47_04610 [Methanosarcina mazei]KKG28350.1 hypothetical protein DU52_09265 [Methanosarcina mazei]KKG33210.1 hypothetical protein DU30_08255 [Methanosarcina mazei]